MNAYSEDLRKKKIVEAKERGMPTGEVARAFGVGVSSVKRYAAAPREGRSLAPKSRPGSKPKLDERPPGGGCSRSGPRGADLGDPPREARVPGEGRGGQGERLHGLADARAPRVEPKKRSLGANERDEFLRAAWRELVARALDGDRFVFVDECGSSTALSPLYAWSRRGERASGLAPRNRGGNATLLASMTSSGTGPCVAVEGPTTRAVFEAYLEGALAPALEPGQVVVMDNLSAHKGTRVREIVEGRGCELLYLPPYSPDLNPIERAFAKLSRPRFGGRGPGPTRR